MSRTPSKAAALPRKAADLDIDALRTFVAVIDAGGFTAAGQRLGRSQSAVSAKIQRLEDSLGKRIFRRTSRSFALTGDGELLLGYARQLLSLNDETVRRVSEPRPQGLFRLGGADYFLPRHLPHVLRQFTALYSSTQVEVMIDTTEGLMKSLDAGKLDLVVARVVERNPPGQTIWSEPLRWVSAPGFKIDPDEPLPFCAMPPPCSFRASALAALQTQGRPWRVVYTSESILGVQAAVSAGMGVAMLSQSAMQPELVVLDERHNLPPLGNIDIAIYGERSAQRRFGGPLADLLLKHLQKAD